ncbi:hypothetical protein MKW94_002117 [Papaver nudicaule]|uniref:TF-B3 domain-containing protein n=1 Tax=Papaver nudicaule TaxID=74823 RepID=A0AA41RXX0_PAPNU|nr:hypothetical protein [Papaver nudicaule]
MEKYVDQGSRKHHFFKSFLEEHKTRLRIPEAFYPRISRESQSCERAVVQGPSRSCWVIKVHKDQDGGIYLEKGWEVFVQENGLQVFDLLVFRYDGSMQFSVKVFNKHGVEREECFTPVRSSPSVERRTTHGRLSAGFQSPLAQQNKRGHGSPSEGLTTKKRRFFDRQQHCDANADRVELDDEESDEDSDQGTDESDEDSNKDEVPEKTITLSSSRLKRIESIERTFASRSSSPFFRVTVQPSYLKHSFLIYFVQNLPDAARRAYFTDDLTEVEVKASDGRSWKVGIISARANMRLSQGVNYLMDKKNGLNLKVGDVCIFEVVKKKSYKLVVQVHVFRY